MTHKKTKRFSSCLFTLFVLGIIFSTIGMIFVFYKIQSEVKLVYGEPDSLLNSAKRILYSSKLYLSEEVLLSDQNDLQENYFFEILPGETVGQISYRLEMNELIRDSEVFKDFLIYKGYDRKVQSGYFRIEPKMNGIEIAEKITSLIPDKVRFNILPGWRAEEIVSILPQSGITVDPDEFLEVIHNPPRELFPTGVETLNSLEGYLFPGEYLIDRETNTFDFIQVFIRSFDENMDEEIFQSLEQQNLTLNEALILASLVQREAVQFEEMPMIASVFLNRHRIGMKLDSDPTVQYALGYNQSQATWWTNPLFLNDLKIDSEFNTYLYTNLPPHPICNPSIGAIQAVAFPETSPYYYFRAKCDGSGYHNFSETFEEHLSKGCP